MADLQELVDAVHRAVGTRPSGSAEVSRDVADTGSSHVHLVHVTPRTPGAAHVTLAVTPDEVALSFGGTSVYLHRDERFPALVEQLVEAVLAGRFAERGPRANAFADVVFADGGRWSGGDLVASWWPRRRGRRYAPCT